MKLSILLTAVTLTLAFCSTKEKKSEISCLVKYDSLFKNYDTSMLIFKSFPSENLLEVLDKPGLTGEHGLFKFDTLGNLLFYAFVHDSANNSNFYIQYDSIGNKDRVQYFGGDILEWKFNRPRPDSLVKIEFLLSELDCEYLKINVEAGKYKTENLKPFKTQFMKVIGASIQFSSSMLDKSRKLKVTGIRKDNCTNLEIPFVDTITVN